MQRCPCLIILVMPLITLAPTGCGSIDARSASDSARSIPIADQSPRVAQAPESAPMGPPQDAAPALPALDTGLEAPISTIAAQAAEQPRTTFDIVPEFLSAGPPESVTDPIDLTLFGDTGHEGAVGAMDDDAENLRQISFSRAGSDFDPVVAPDGEMIYYASTAHSPTSDIYVKRIDGVALTQLTQGPASDVTPAVSPDGAKVAFASDRTGNWDLFIMNSEGGQAIQLTSDPAAELHPTWSPDGRYIAFSRMGQVSGRWEIWVTEAENSAVSRFLTYGLFPAWHPEKNTLLFQRSRERGDRFFSVWTVDLIGGEATAPTIIASSVTAAIINPKWSPDGQYIAASTIIEPQRTAPGTRPARADIWIMKADGSSRANLTGGYFVNLMPTWGPDGTLYFVSDRNGRDNIWARATDQAIIAAGGTPLSDSYRARAATESGGRGPETNSDEHSAEIADAPTDISHQR